MAATKKKQKIPKHKNKNVIFFSLFSYRLDMWKNLDGIWDEHADEDHVITCNGYLHSAGIPGITWVRHNPTITNSWLQNNLLLGLFTHAPFQLCV